MLYYAFTGALIITILNPGLALCSLIEEGANAYTKIIEVHHRMNNMYFYAAVGLLMASIPAMARLRRGGQMRPRLSRAVAGLIRSVNFVCILFLVIHFMPETDNIFDWIVGVFGRLKD